MEASNVQKFYNDRAEEGYRSSLQFGSLSALPYLKEPYAYIEQKLSRLDHTKKRLLDVCCGNGTHSFAFAKMGYKVDGCDISDKMIEIAKRTAISANMTNSVSFQTANLCNPFPFKDDTFDVVYISGSLYYLDLDATLSEIKRVLKKDGYFCCVETNGTNFLMTTFRKIKNIFRHHRDQNTLSHLLKRQEILRVASAFYDSEIKYFGFLVLLAEGLRFSPWLAEKWTSLIRYIDWFLLNKLNLHSYGFKFVIIGRNH